MADPIFCPKEHEDDDIGECVICEWGPCIEMPAPPASMLLAMSEVMRLQATRLGGLSKRTEGGRYDMLPQAKERPPQGAEGPEAAGRPS